METSFDKVAGTYDTTFTYSTIGKMQRDLVHHKLSKYLDSVKTILEINCGTGEDAIALAKQNFKITATDISPMMIEKAKTKGTYQNLNFVTADINTIVTTFVGQQFDLIFSNFGGLNCLTKSELENFFLNADLLLTKKGKLVLVIMPKNTLWEQFYFFTKSQFSKVFRRKKEMTLANVDGKKVPTYYYNPKDIVNLSKANFELMTQKPIGFFVPPSYLETVFKNKKGLLQFLNTLEKGITSWSFLSKYADHYLITLQKK